MRLVPVKDIAQIVAWSQDVRCKEYFRRFPPSFTWTREGFQNNYYIVDESEKILGLVAIAGIYQQNKSAELGCLIDPEVKDKRAIYVPALTELINYVFDYLDFNKVFVLVLTERHKLAQYSTDWAFKLDGRLRDNIRFEGKWHDELLLSLTKQDWKNHGRNASK